MDLILAGHTHLYQRGCRLRRMPAKRHRTNVDEYHLQEGDSQLNMEFSEKRVEVFRDDDTVCFMSIGGGGGQLELEEERVEDWKLFHRTIFDHHYVELRVEEKQVTFTVLDINNNILDTLAYVFN